jgi:glycosyltransferase involved in cell wall biosynthesis
MAVAAPESLKAVFCWSELPAYMPACWRALARRGVDVHVLHPKQLYAGVDNLIQAEPLMAGLSHELFESDRQDLGRWLVQAVAAQRPDVVVHCGWIFRPYRGLASAPLLSGVPMVLGMDSPWRGTPAQRLAPLRLGAFMRRMRMVITAGDRSAEYARRIGADPRRIRAGYYGFDGAQLSGVAAARVAAAEWPRQFLFVGRYVDQKDLPALMKAYSAYRSRVDDPWGLTCYGDGPEGRHLQGVAGVTNGGYVQPPALPDIFRRHGVFVLPSHFEPWGVVIAEAAASGLPVICTSACGASVDLVRNYYNGIITAPSDPEGLTRALLWMHHHAGELPQMGERGRALADAFSAESWAARWHRYLEEAVEA